MARARTRSLRATRGSPCSAALAHLYTRGAEDAARAIGERTERARAWVSGLLEFEPHVRLEVLGIEDWAARAKQPMYGMPHFGYDGTIYVAATYADLFGQLVEMTLADVPDEERTSLEAVYGQPPNVQPFADLLSLHELAHLYHAQAGFTFGRWWLNELFCNIALEGYVVDPEPHARRVLETFPVAARHIRPSRVALSAIDDMDEARGVNYGWYELRLHAAAIRIWQAGGGALLRDLYDQHRAAAASSEPIPLEDLYPEIARVAHEWP